MFWGEFAPLVAGLCAQAGLPSDAGTATTYFRHQLSAAAPRVDVGYPHNTDLVPEHGRQVLERRKGASSGAPRRSRSGQRSTTGSRIAGCWTS